MLLKLVLGVKPLITVLLIVSATAILALADAKEHVLKRSRRELFRGNVDPAQGGKVPESYLLRAELNKIDQAGLNNERAKQMSEALKNVPLPDKASPGSSFPTSFGSPLGFGPPPSSFRPGTPTTDSDNSADYSEYSDSDSSNNDFFGSDFGFDNPNLPFSSSFFDNFDSQKISADEDQTPEIVRPADGSFREQKQLIDNFDMGDPYNNYDDDEQSNYADLLDKPYLFTADPYANSVNAPAPAPYQPYYPAPDLDGYSPPAYSFPDSYEPYKPVGEDYYSRPKPSYEAELPYEPAKPYRPVDHYKPTDPYRPVDSYEPADPYKPVDSYEPADPYKPANKYKPKPYKPVGPVLLEKRPHEVKEIRPLPVTVQDTYTSFDCRKAPYPDRHYADPEAGCSIYHFCHKDGKQDTFHCPKGTIFNEYLGTCDHDEAVYCHKGNGYAGDVSVHHHAQQHHDYHESPRPYRPKPKPKPSYQEPSYHDSYYERARSSDPRPLRGYEGYRRPSKVPRRSSKVSGESAVSSLSPSFEEQFGFARNFPGFGAPF